MTNNSEPFSRPISTVITVPDPDAMPVSSHAEKGGTLQWRTDTHNYPKFEIRFQGANPFNADMNQILSGDDLQPVTIRLKTVGDFEYTIRHYKKDGSSKDIVRQKFRVTPCTGCPP